MTDTDAIRLFKCLADKSRLQILKSLAAEDMYVERLAERLGLSAPTVSFHLKKLADAGAVKSYKTQYYTMYTLCTEVFQTRMIDVIREKSEEADLQAERDEAYRKKVIDAFMEYGKLKSIPAQRKKKRIILEEICKVFEPGRLYAEKEVNLLIADFHDDFCTLRRDMISEGLMQRDGQHYWLHQPQSDPEEPV